VIVAVASTGRRLPATLAAVVAALAFDYFLTIPYESFRITNHQDLISEILLIVVGLAVGELAVRGRRHREAASRSSQRVAQLHAVTELTATGRDSALVVASAADALRELLSLRECRFTRGDAGDATARVTPDGEVVIGSETWSTEALGLPTKSVDLPVRSSGWLLGHFLLTPTPGVPVSGEQLRLAVTMADQVGAALAAEEQRTTGGPDAPGPAPLPDTSSR
jgi:K+-sensing histidine kinase KdpD